MSIIDSRAPSGATDTARRFRAVAPVAIGAGATIVTAIGSWQPSMWGDEAASVMSAQRPWSSLLEMAGNIDAVHVVYYAFLHLWIDVFGASAFSVRLPSAIAIGLTVAGVFVLANRLADTRLALLASIFCVLLPRVSFMGAEARSSAIAAAMATWLTVLLLEMVRRPASKGLVALYAAGVALSAHIFLYTILVLAVHAAVLVALRARRTIWLRWASAGAIASALCLPFFVICVGQRGQIGFLAHRDATSPGKILVEQWFGDLAFAVVAWILIGIACIAWWRSRSRTSEVRDSRPADDPGTAGRRDGYRLVLLLSASWLIVPLALLLTTNLIAGPLYSPRYVSFSAPAAAILMAVAVEYVHRWWARGAAVLVVLALALPISVAQRGPTAKFGSDWAQVSTFIGEHSKPGDGIVFDEDVRSSRKPRLALHLYPEGFTDVVDLGLRRPYWQTSHLWDEVDPLDRRPEVLAGRERVWVISRSRDGTDGDEESLERAGFRLDSSTRIVTNVVHLYTKETE
ncbi:glycosyltransferase family 39 protein [Okibacterium endophyticum]